jgi:hypothetical protein
MSVLSERNSSSVSTSSPLPPLLISSEPLSSEQYRMLPAKDSRLQACGLCHRSTVALGWGMMVDAVLISGLVGMEILLGH